MRAVDLPCRYGGEEFVVIMPGTQLADAEKIAERIRRHVAGSPIRASATEELLTVTISIGVAATSGEGDTADALLKRADEGVYAAKPPATSTWSSPGRLEGPAPPPSRPGPSVGLGSACRA